MTPAEDQQRQQQARAILHQIGDLGDDLLELMPQATCGARCESAGFDVEPCHLEPHDRGEHEALSVSDGATVVWADTWADERHPVARVGPEDTETTKRRTS